MKPGQNFLKTTIHTSRAKLQRLKKTFYTTQTDLKCVIRFKQQENGFCNDLYNTSWLKHLKETVYTTQADLIIAFRHCKSDSVV